MILELLAAVTALYGVRLWFRYISAMRGGEFNAGRTVEAPHLATAIVVFAVAVMLTPGLLRRADEASYSKVASEVAGVDVDVHCQTIEETFMDSITKMGKAGWVEWTPDGPSSTANLTRGICSTLDDFDADDGLDDAEIVALQVLTHEAMHVRGERNEAVTECQAMQRMALVAVGFGATHEQGTAAAARVEAVFKFQMPARYRSNDCVRHGPLDERLGHGPWSG